MAQTAAPSAPILQQLEALRPILGDEAIRIILDPGLASLGSDSTRVDKHSATELLNACRGCMIGMAMAWDDICKLMGRMESIHAELVRREASGRTTNAARRDRPCRLPASTASLPPLPATDTPSKPLLAPPRPKRRHYRRPIQCVETGKVFASTSDANKAMGITGAYQAAKQGCSAHGFHFIFLEPEDAHGSADAA